MDEVTSHRNAYAERKDEGMMEKLPVSVVIIAKNEEKKIGRCLDSVRWADEVIVVDGLSRDRTVEIASSAGAKVVPHEFTGAFADDRNLGMETARNEWVLQLDADDVVTDAFRARLEEMLSRKSDVPVYKFRRRNFFLGHPMDHGGFCHYLPNLLRRTVRYEGKVHEVPSTKGAVGTIEADVDHFPFDSLGQFVERQNRYSDIAAADLFGKEGSMDEKKIRSGMLGRSFKIFWKSYVKKQGYKEGLYGLVFAILFAFINFLKWAKYWHLVEEMRKKDV